MPQQQYHFDPNLFTNGRSVGSFPWIGGCLYRENLVDNAPVFGIVLLNSYFVVILFFNLFGGWFKYKNFTLYFTLKNIFYTTSINIAHDRKSKY